MGRRLKKYGVWIFWLASLLAGPQGILAQENNSSPSFINQFFSEQILTVTNEGDGFVPGTLRTVLIQAAGIRKNNPFTLVKIIFDPNVRTSRIVKGPLRMEGGLIQIDCAAKVSIDGSLFDTRYLDEKEPSAGILIRSSGNAVKSCKIFGFPGKNIVIAGNRNQIRENIIGISSASRAAANPYAALASAVDENRGVSNTGIYLEDNASENLIESNNILGHKSEGIAFSSLVGPGNRIVGNAFNENGVKGIQSGENQYRSFKPTIKSIVKEGDSYLLSGTLSEPGEVEIYLAGASGREGKMPITPPTMMNRGDFVLGIKNKGFIPGLTRLVMLLTTSGKNTSEFSEAALIPVDAPRHELIPQAPTPPAPPAESSNPSIPAENTSSPIPSSSSNYSAPVSAPAIDPFLNATTLPPPPVPQIVDPPTHGGPLPKSGISDSVRTESVFTIGNGP